MACSIAVNVSDSEAVFSVAIFQSLSCVQLFANPWTAVCQTSLSFTVSRSLLTSMSIESDAAI